MLGTACYLYKVTSRREVSNLTGKKASYQNMSQYSRVTHFDTKFDEATGQNGPVPDELITLVEAYVKPDCSPTDVVSVLKQRGELIWLQHSTFICAKISGKSFQIPSAIRDRCREHFLEFERGFEHSRSAHRPSFPNYNYVIHRLLEHHAGKEFADLFPLMKAPAKIADHDDMWRRVCAELKWQTEV